jgi:molybdopterin-guanine dinucleotide biosynthesis protein A
MQIAGLILAGGTSRRTGGREKAFLPVGGMPMLARIIGILTPQCGLIAISANGDPARFAAYDLPVIADRATRGPMSGLADSLDWFAANHPEISHVLSVPSDTPFLPDDLGTCLAAALEAGDTFCACAASGGHLHPVAGLWPLEARYALHDAVARGVYSFHAALEGKNVARTEWNSVPVDPFYNINTLEELAYADALRVGS